MMYLRKLMLIVQIFCCFSALTHASSLDNKAFRNFWHPTYLGVRLDYCTLDGKLCGKAVADRYCQLLGYDYASHEVIAYNLGLTHFLLTKARCKGWRCSGFMTIGCASKLSHRPPKSYHYREKLFVHPRFDDYRVNWCYDHNQCGARAANSFCSRMGFLKAKHFKKEAGVSATKSLGNQALCFGKLCNSFEGIVCYR